MRVDNPPAKERKMTNRTEASCQCLAAWINTADCVCGKPTGNPIKLDAKNLAYASRLMDEIKILDRAPASIEKAGGKYEHVKVRIEDSDVHNANYGSWTEIVIPVSFAKSLIFYARAEKYEKLRKTGIVSR